MRILPAVVASVLDSVYEHRRMIIFHTTLKGREGLLNHRDTVA